MALDKKAKKRKPRPGDLVASAADEDKKEDPNYGGTKGDPLTKTGIKAEDEDSHRR